ncbi:MAG: hypothetical protein ACRDK2_12875 [Solirubrobacteraceae bacterium]
MSSVHAYLDTQLLAEACWAMAEVGVSEAAAEPIRDHHNRGPRATLDGDGGSAPG